MRLIDAEELGIQLIEEGFDFKTFSRIIDIIAELPVLDIERTLESAYQEGYNEGYDFAKKTKRKKQEDEA